MKQILVEAFKLVDQSKLPILDKYNYIFKSNQITFIITKKWTSALLSEILESVLQTVQKKQFTYRQYLLTDCTEDNVQKNTYIYSVHTVYYNCQMYTSIHVYNVHILHYVHIYTL